VKEGGFPPTSKLVGFQPQIIMKIIVCIKQVPDTTEVKVNEKTGTLIREGVPSIINPFDQFAVEEGVRLKEKLGGEVIALSMGPAQARIALMKCLALGADKAILLTDSAFVGADTWATSYILSLAIKQIDDFNLVLCGQQAIDGDTAQVGPELAQQLRIPQVTYVESVDVDGKKLTAKKQIDDGYEIVETKTPALLTMTTPTDFIPTNPAFSAIMKAKKKPYEEWGADKLKGGDPDKYGLTGSLTQVKRVYSPPKREKGIMIEGGTPQEIARKFVEYLIQENLV